MKSKIIITKDMSMDDRLEALRKASKKFNKKIQRNHKIKRTDEKWIIKSTSGQILKRNKNLIYLLNYFKNKKLSIVE